MNPFVEKVTELLKAQKITKNKMLSDLNLNRNSFVDWAKRGTIPNAKVVSAIAEYLGTTVNVLLEESGNELLSSSHERFLDEDTEWLSLIHRLPEKKRMEFKIRIEGYLECYEESVAADNPQKTGTDSPK